MASNCSCSRTLACSRACCTASAACRCSRLLATLSFTCITTCPLKPTAVSLYNCPVPLAYPAACCLLPIKLPPASGPTQQARQQMCCHNRATASSVRSPIRMRRLATGWFLAVRKSNSLLGCSGQLPKARLCKPSKLRSSEDSDMPQLRHLQSMLCINKHI